jgi:hypothetical protein
MCHDKRWGHLAEAGVPWLSGVTVAETKNWIVKPDILPARPDGNHFILRPKNHTINHLEGYEGELGHIIKYVEDSFGNGEPIAIMKHGDVHEEGGTMMSVRHDHTHLFPGVGSGVLSYLRDVAKRQGIAYQIVERADDLAYVNPLRTVF